jgi:hypothetical protein
MDGQHRFLAAKSLGVAIHYTQSSQLKPEDIVALNMSKAWGMHDFLNYYIKNGFQEYIKLQAFVKKHRISPRVAFTITMGVGKVTYHDFKLGKYVFNDEAFSDELDVCWDTITYIKRMNGSSPYTSSTRFWLALIKLIRHADFDPERWKSNLGKFVDHFTPKARSIDYLKLFMDTYNWRSTNKINLIEERKDMLR